jgi:hypothetical protein
MDTLCRLRRSVRHPGTALRINATRVTPNVTLPPAPIPAVVCASTRSGR